MIDGIRVVVSYLLGKDRADRHFAVYPGDTFVISYPRSGSTWSRFLIANLIHPEQPVTFTDLDRLLPATAAVSNRALKRTPRPRIIKCHNYFDHRYQKVIYIVRDPRDVVLSEYRFILKRRGIPDGYPMELFVDRFLRGDLNSYGSWKENVASWVMTRASGDSFLLLRYEDMVDRTVQELDRVAAFLGVDATPQRLAQAAERSSASNMRAMERAQSEDWIVTKGSRKDVPFVGDARAGAWKAKLSAGCVEKIERAWGPLMMSLGYKLATGDFAPIPLIGNRSGLREASSLGRVAGG